MTAALTRQQVAHRLLSRQSDLLVVAGLGGTAWDVRSIGFDRLRTFYMWGGMGLATSVGLGLARSQPADRVLVLTGDGEMLMGLGSLATVARAWARNLAIVVIDNQLYGETGRQESHTADTCDLVGVARAAGIKNSRVISNEEELDQLALEVLVIPHLAHGPIFAAVPVPGQVSHPPAELPPRDGAYMKHRFREDLMGPDAHR